MGNYHLTSGDPEEALNNINKIFDDVVSNREKWYLIQNKDGIPAVVIMNAEEHTYLKRIFERRS